MSGLTQEKLTTYQEKVLKNYTNYMKNPATGAELTTNEYVLKMLSDREKKMREMALKTTPINSEPQQSISSTRTIKEPEFDSGMPEEINSVEDVVQTSIKNLNDKMREEALKRRQLTGCMGSNKEFERHPFSNQPEDKCLQTVERGLDTIVNAALQVGLFTRIAVTQAARYIPTNVQACGPL